MQQDLKTALPLCSLLAIISSGLKAPANFSNKALEANLYIVANTTGKAPF